MADGDKSLRRRTVLRATGGGALVGLTGLAGCTGNGDDGNGNGTGNGNGDDDGDDGPQYSWSIGTSGEETATHASGVAFSSIINEHSDMIEMSAQTTGGTTANNRLVDEGDVDIGQTTHNLIWRANQGLDPYDDPPLEKTLCQMFSYMTLDVFMTRSENLEGVETVEDIPEGTAMSWGPRGTSGFDIARDGFETLGIDDWEDRYDMEFMGLGDQADAVREGRLDVALTYTANQQVLIGWIQELFATTESEPLEWGLTQEDIDAADVPLALATIEASDVWDDPVQHDSISAIPMGYTSVFPADIPDEAAYEYTKILIENHQQVRDAHAVLERHGPDFATEWLQPDGVPVHPGAEQYLKEEDLWRDDLTTLEEFES